MGNVRMVSRGYKYVRQYRLTVALLPETFLLLPPVHKDNNYKGSIYMVFDYAEYDLTGFMESQKCRFPEAQVR
jgi:hypothetical protein